VRLTAGPRLCELRPVLLLMILTGSLTPCLTVRGAGPEPPGWFAGDPHVHRGIGCGRNDATKMLTPEELLEGMKENDLAVISVLGDIGNGEIRDASRDWPLINGKDHPASNSKRILHWDAEWHFDPKGVTFEQKAIGGHLIILGLRHGEKIFSEYTYPIFAWAKKQGAIAGFAHMQYLPPDIPKVLDCCVPLEYPVETALGSSAFLMEDVDGSDTAIQAYYRLLNCGFRPGLVAATDFPCNKLEPFGTLLTYVQIPDGKLSYRRWIEGIAHGRTVVSRNGHNEFLALKVNRVVLPGDEVHLKGRGSVQVDIRWSSTKSLTGKVELVRNGLVVASREGTATPDSPLVFQSSQNFDQSGWLCARRMDEKGHQSHTGAVFISVNKTPVRASVEDAEYFVRFIDHLTEAISPGGEWSQYFPRDRDALLGRFRQAKAIYHKIATEAKTVKEHPLVGTSPR
jgi:hypothetical protein